MVALSLPFIWLGVSMTIKRLRSAGFAPQLVALFFLPFLNLLFFLVLCLSPEKHCGPAPSGTIDPLANQSSFPATRTSISRILPEGAIGSAAVSLLITIPVGLATAWLGTQILRNYGWGLFIALPFVMGFTAALIYGSRQPRSAGAQIGVACLSVVLLGAALMALAFGGLICFAMAAPFAFPRAAWGGFCPYAKKKNRRYDSPAFVAILLLFTP